MFNKIGVYIIENTKTNKYYVGSTMVGFRTRVNKHLGTLRRGVHHSKKLQRSFKKHGEDVFKFRILEVCSKDEVRAKEQEWIDYMTPFYNMTLIVDGGVDNLSYESRLKISKIQGGKPIEICDLEGNVLKTVNFQYEAAEFVKGLQSSIFKCLSGLNSKHKNHMFRYVGEDFTYVNRIFPTRGMLGKRHSEETKALMSKSSKGRKHSEAHRKKTSDAMKKQWFCGERVQSKITDTTKINMSRAKFNGILVVTDKEGNELFSCWGVSDASSILKIKKSSIAGVLCGQRNSVYGYKFNKKTLVADSPRLESKEDLKG